MKIRIPIVVCSLFLVLAMLACSSAPAAPTAAPTQAAKPAAPTAAPAQPAKPAAPTAAPAKPAQPAKTWSLTYASYVGEDWIAHDLSKIWSQEMDKRTGGRVKIGKWLFGASLLKMDQMTQGIGSGMADMGYVNSTIEETRWPLVSSTDMIYLTEAVGARPRVLFKLYDTYAPLKAEFDKNNLFPLLYEDSVGAVFGGKGKMVTTLEDIKGLRVRAYGMTTDVVAKFGGTPMVISTGDLYTALQKGTVEAFTALVPSALDSLKYNEVIDWVIDPGFGLYASDGNLMNLNVWRSFPPDIQKIALDLREELLAKGIQMYYDLNLNSLKKTAAKGVKLYVLPDAEKARWRAAVDPEATLWKAWIDKRVAAGAPAREYVDLFIKELPAARLKTNYPANSVVFKEAMGIK